MMEKKVAWNKRLDKTLLNTFGVEAETTYDIIEGCYVTLPINGNRFDNETRAFIQGFMAAVESE